jgi:hypothetical protein
MAVLTVICSVAVLLVYFACVCVCPNNSMKCLLIYVYGIVLLPALVL